MIPTAHEDITRVVAFPKVTKRGTSIVTREDLIDTIRADLYGRDLELLANRIGVCVSTLYSIRSGRTKWPRHTTLLTLIHALGFELQLVRL